MGEGFIFRHTLYCTHQWPCDLIRTEKSFYQIGSRLSIPVASPALMCHALNIKFTLGVGSGLRTECLFVRIGEVNDAVDAKKNGKTRQSTSLGK